MRSLRAGLSKSAQTAAARSLARRFAQIPELRFARRIAGYLAVRGEIDPADILRRARRRGARVALPSVLGPQHMAFFWDSAERPARTNRFGIREPVPTSRNRCRLSALSVVLLPALACDPRGSRIGTGGGFYDRALGSRCGAGAQASRPLLVAVVHDFQIVDRIESRPWDVPVDFVLSERRTLDCRLKRTTARQEIH